MGKSIGPRARTLGLCLPLLVASGCVTSGGLFGQNNPAPASMSAGGSIVEWFTRRPSAPPPGMIVKKKSLPPDKLARKELQNPTKVHLAYAKWQEQIGQVTEARESYQFVLKDEPRSTDAILGIARIDQLNGRTAEAEAGIQHALELAPDDPHVLDAAGQFFATAERWKESLELLNKAVLNAPGDKAIRFHLAVATARSGQPEASRPHFVQAVGEAEADYNLGLILYEQGQVEACRHRMQMAIALRPDFPEARLWLDELNPKQQQQQQPVQLASGQQQARPQTQAVVAAAPEAVASPSNMPQTRMPEAPAPTRAEPTAAAAPGGSGHSQTAVSSPAVTSVGRQSSPVLSAPRPPTSGTAAAETTASRPASIPAQVPLPPSLTPEQREQWENQFAR